MIMSSYEPLISDPLTFIGKTEEETVLAIREHHLFRVVERDGVAYESTTSFLPTRWNLYIKEGLVIDIRMF